MKIQIIGYSGAGKSTLAKALGEIYNVPVLHLDNVQFYGDWQEKSKQEQNEIVNKFLDENDGWVIDGNYTEVAPRRFEISDITIYLNFNRFFCYRSCKRRYKQHRFIPRESCPCPDKFDKSFRRWILIDGRTKKRKQKNMNNLNKTKGEKLIFTNRKQVNAWLNTLKKNK